MFINDMFNCVGEKTDIALYADDTKIWREIINWDDHLALQNDINCLLQWSILNKLYFHPDKCKVISIAKKIFEPILPFQLYHYKLGDNFLNYADSEKDLGIIVNTTLTNDDQCRKTYTIMNQKLGMMKRVCYFTNVKIKNVLFTWLLSEVTLTTVVQFGGLLLNLKLIGLNLYKNGE